MKIIEPKEVIFFEDSRGRKPYLKWLESLDMSIRSRINQRILRLSIGNYGDFKTLQEGVSELRFNFGPGYRIYFGEDSKKILILLSGGDKKTQSKDIKKAIEYWKEYKGNKNG